MASCCGSSASRFRSSASASPARSSSASGSGTSCDYGLDAWWIWASLVLWVIANALGGIGGRHQERLAEARRAAGRRRRHDRRPSCARCCATRREIAMSWLAGLATIADPHPDDLEAGRVMRARLQPPVLAALPARARRDGPRSARSLAAVILSAAAWRAPDSRRSRRAAFWALLVAAIPA